tara:strand:+ start:322 stop:1986 length:1665 start_codon:yes stop_codon:yes gene_type:complete
MTRLEKFLKPMPLSYDYQEWKKKSYTERAKKVCQNWALQGYGSPISVTIFYFIKIIFYVFMFFWFCSFSNDLGGISEFSLWWTKTEALGKFIFWTVLIEIIGLGGASGPLTGRYAPIIGGITYFLRPKTVKVPLFPKIPFLGNDSRNWLDIGLYLLLLIALIRVCVASDITPSIVIPVIILLLICGLLDRTIFLAARGDIYLPMAVCFLFSLETGAGLKIIWFGIWFWAAFSKLTPNFTSAVNVMISNSVLFIPSCFDNFKKSLFKSYPEDLRPSRKANNMAHFGTFIEFVMPILLITFMGNAEITFFALIAITLFHIFIFANFPMGVPLEWNVIMVYGAWMLFYGNPAFNPLDISSPILIAVLSLSLFIFPILGNLFPKYISFLLSMRYYAGTWAYSVWLFKGDAKDVIEEKIPKTSKDVLVQMEKLYETDFAEGIISMILGFRLMHLPGRLINQLVPKAIDSIHDYRWIDGEALAGEVVGWNFGDGHLHNETLLNSIQKRCNYKSEQLRVIMVESPQFHTQNLEYRIYDAHDGLIEKGTGNTRALKDIQPWE